MGDMKPYNDELGLTEMRDLEDVWVKFGTDLPKELKVRLGALKIAYINELQQYYGTN